MKQKLLSFIAALFSLPLFALSVDSSSFFHEPITPSRERYVMYVNIYDWGPAVDFAVVNVGLPVAVSDLHREDFEVGVFGMSAGKKIDIVTGYREVTDVFLCDENGSKLSEEKGQYIALCMSVHPDDSISNPFVSFPASILKKGIKTLRVRNSALSIDIAKTDGVNCPLLSGFSEDCFEKDEYAMHYASWIPEIKDSAQKVPLIVWLHGISEGGEDGLAPLVACRVGELTKKEVQSSFGENGVALLVPQAKTSWLESTTKDVFGNNIWVPVDIEEPVKSLSKKLAGKLTQLFDRISVDSGQFEAEFPEKEPTATVSIYTEVLKDLIVNYIAEHSEIDENRIYIGGFSAGGYMTVNMILRYPELFAAAFPVSEVYPNSKLTKGDIEELSKMPLWFVHSKDDGVAKIEKYDFATVRRLEDIGAQNLHYTLYNCIVDVDGLYFDEDENVWQYSGHDAHIPLFRGEVYEEGLSIFDWLASNRRK